MRRVSTCRRLNPGYAALATRIYESKPVRTAVVDSNSTRTESYVAIRPDPEARMQVDAPKAVDHNGCRQIIHLKRGMRAGLKILVSAGQSRPSPPFISTAATTYALITFSNSPVTTSHLVGTWPITLAWSLH